MGVNGWRIYLSIKASSCNHTFVYRWLVFTGTKPTMVTFRFTWALLLIVPWVQAGSFYFIFITIRSNDFNEFQLKHKSREANPLLTIFFFLILHNLGPIQSNSCASECRARESQLIIHYFLLHFVLPLSSFSPREYL